MNTPQEIALLITDLTLKKGKSINKMLSECGAGKGLLDRMRIGQEPAARKLKLVADYLEVSTDYLLTGEKSNLKLVTNEKENMQMNDEKILRFAAAPLWDKFRALRKERRLTIGEIENKTGVDYNKDFEEKGALYNTALVGRDDFVAELVKLIDFFEEPNIKITAHPFLLQHEEKYLLENEYMATDLSTTIREKRMAKALTQKELADSLNLEEISIISWESAERVPNWELIKLLGGKLDFPDWLMKEYAPKTYEFFREDGNKAE